MSSEVETSLANVRRHQGAPVFNRRLCKVDGLVSCQLLQRQIVRDSSTSLGMTKREDTYAGIGPATAQQRSSKVA